VGSWGGGVTKTAVGYRAGGGPPPGSYGTVLRGCTASAPMAQELDIAVMNASGPGQYTAGSVGYTDEMGKTWNSTVSMTVTISSFGPVGGSIDGTLAIIVSQGGNAAHSLDGTFHVCRVPDFLAP
jgi:hypothetical protein